MKNVDLVLIIKKKLKKVRFLFRKIQNKVYKKYRLDFYFKKKKKKNPDFYFKNCRTDFFS